MLVLVFTALFSSIDFAPILFQDELMNVDLGRSILNANTDWSIAWMANESQPVFLLSYIGPVLQELAYQFIGELGPRISGLLGAFAAATAMVGWLLSKGISYKVAFILGIVFLLDPLFVHAYTTARVDGWAMALCILSCWILRNNFQVYQHSRYNHLIILISGALSALAFFVWPSAVFIFPLIFLELSDRASRWKDRDSNRKTLLIFEFGIGGLMMGGILLIPITPQILALFDIIIQALIVNVHPGNEIETSYLGDKFATLIELLRVLKFTPVLFLVALVGAIWCRRIELIIACLTATILLLNTVVYINRVLYLLPYFILCISYLYTHERMNTSARLLKNWSIAMLIVWSVGLSIGVRTYLAFDAQNERDRNIVQKAALTLVGPGNHKVYIPFDMYYAGRTLGWQMYKAYLAYNNPLTFETLRKVLPHVDYVIMIQYELTEEIEQGLIEEGWVDSGVLHVYCVPSEPFNGVTTNEVRVRNLYSIFSKPYGPYRLFIRGNSTYSLLSKKLSVDNHAHTTM